MENEGELDGCQVRKKGKSKRKREREGEHDGYERQRRRRGPSEVVEESLWAVFWPRQLFTPVKVTGRRRAAHTYIRGAQRPRDDIYHGPPWFPRIPEAVNMSRRTELRHSSQRGKQTLKFLLMLSMLTGSLGGGRENIWTGH